MAQQTYTEGVILLGGVDVSLNTFRWAYEPQVAMRDMPSYGAKGFMVRRPGLKMATLAVSGWADYDAGAVNEYVALNVGTRYPVSVSIPGSAAGDPAWVVAGPASRVVAVGGPVGDPAPFATTVESDTVHGRGVLLHPPTARTTTGNGTAVAQAGPSAGRTLYAALHVLAVSGGTPSLTVKVQSDDSGAFSSATDRITFSAANAVGWQWGSVAGDFSTETHLRVTWTISGSTPSFTFAVAAFIV